MVLPAPPEIAEKREGVRQNRNSLFGNDLSDGLERIEKSTFYSNRGGQAKLPPNY